MHENDVEIAIKIIVVGNGVVGKSSLIRQYCQGVFTSGYKKTIGVDFLERRTVSVWAKAPNTPTRVGLPLSK